MCVIAKSLPEIYLKRASGSFKLGLRRQKSLCKCHNHPKYNRHVRRCLFPKFFLFCFVFNWERRLVVNISPSALRAFPGRETQSSPHGIPSLGGGKTKALFVCVPAEGEFLRSRLQSSRLQRSRLLLRFHSCSEAPRLNSPRGAP